MLSGYVSLCLLLINSNIICHRISRVAFSHLREARHVIRARADKEVLRKEAILLSKVGLTSVEFEEQILDSFKFDSRILPDNLDKLPLEGGYTKERVEGLLIRRGCINPVLYSSNVGDVQHLTGVKKGFYNDDIFIFPEKIINANIADQSKLFWPALTRVVHKLATNYQMRDGLKTILFRVFIKKLKSSDCEEAFLDWRSEEEYRSVLHSCTYSDELINPVAPGGKNYFWCKKTFDELIEADNLDRKGSR
jgi:hypothetical protein